MSSGYRLLFPAVDVQVWTKANMTHLPIIIDYVLNLKNNMVLNLLRIIINEINQAKVKTGIFIIDIININHITVIFNVVSRISEETYVYLYNNVIIQALK